MDYIAFHTSILSSSHYHLSWSKCTTKKSKSNSQASHNKPNSVECTFNRLSTFRATSWLYRSPIHIWHLFTLTTHQKQPSQHSGNLRTFNCFPTTRQLPITPHSFFAFDFESFSTDIHHIELVFALQYTFFTNHWMHICVCLKLFIVLQLKNSNHAGNFWIAIETLFAYTAESLPLPREKGLLGVHQS